MAKIKIYNEETEQWEQIAPSKVEFDSHLSDYTNYQRKQRMGAM